MGVAGVRARRDRAGRAVAMGWARAVELVVRASSLQGCGRWEFTRIGWHATPLTPASRLARKCLGGIDLAESASARGLPADGCCAAATRGKGGHDVQGIGWRRSRRAIISSARARSGHESVHHPALLDRATLVSIPHHPCGRAHGLGGRRHPRRTLRGSPRLPRPRPAPAAEARTHLSGPGQGRVASRARAGRGGQGSSPPGEPRPLRRVASAPGLRGGHDRRVAL